MQTIQVKFRRIQFLSYLFFFLFIGNLVLSCSDGKQEDDRYTEVLDIDNTVSTKPMACDKYQVDSCVQLSAPEKIILTGDDDVLLKNGNIYILNRVRGGKLLVFSGDGKFKFSVGQMGHAQNELLSGPSDFSVDSAGNMYLFGQDCQKILVYNNKGQYMHTVNLAPEWPFAFTTTSDGDFMFAYRMVNDKIKDNTELAIFSQQLQCKRRLVPLKHSQLYSVNEHPFGHVGAHDISFIPNFSDRVFVLSSNTVKRIIKIKFKTGFVPSDKISKMERDGDPKDLLLNKENVQNICHYDENNQWIKVDYEWRNFRVHYLKHRKSGRVLLNGVSFFEGFFPANNAFLSGNHLVFLITDNDISQMRNSHNVMGAKSWTECLNQSSSAIKAMIEGKIKAPALLFVSIPDPAE